MTYQGMHRDSVSHTAQSYILIPNSGDQLPERLDPAQALRLVKDSADHVDNDLALLKISDRIQSDHELESQVRGFWMTDKGLLIHGTMDAAFRLTNAFDMKEPAAAEEVPVSNITFLRDIRQTFGLSVDYYRGQARQKLGHISNAFDGLAGIAGAAAQAANEAHRYSEPKLALAA